MNGTKNTDQLSEKTTLQKEFYEILSFTSEICEVPILFITQLENNKQVIKAEIGFESLGIPKQIAVYIESIIQQNTAVRISNIQKNLSCQPKKKRDNDLTFDFFYGIPICNSKNIAIGTLCILNTKSKELSPIQSKLVNHSALRIQALIELKQQNQDLQNKIKEKENQFEIFKENSKELFYELSQEGVITYVSKNWKKFLGYEPEEVVGKSNISILHPEDIEMITDFLNNVVKTGNNTDEITFRILHKDGYYVWHSTSLKISEKEGATIYIGNCRDVTEQVINQQKIIEQKEFYEKILDRIPTDVAVFDSNHKYIYLNPFAIKNEELRKFIIGKNDFEYAKHTGRNKKSAQKRRIKFIQAGVSKKLVAWEEEYTNSEGESTYHTRKYNPVFHEDGSLEMMVGFGVDITEIKNTQQEILKSKQLLSSILGNVAVGILVQGPHSEIIEINNAACQMLGLSEDQLLGKTASDELWNVAHLDGTTFVSDDFPVSQAIKQLKPIKDIVMGVYSPLTKERVWLLVDAMPVFDKFKTLLYVVSSFNNITKLKKVQDELKISNERFNLSNKATSDVIWDWDLISQKVYLGEGYEEAFGFPLNNTIKELGSHNLVHPLDKNQVYDTINEAILGSANSWEAEYHHLKADNSYATVKDKAYILRDNNGKAIRIIGAMQDISLEKKLKDKLQQSEERFKGTFEHSPVGMSIMSTDGYWVEINDQTCKILGYSKDELKKLRFRDISFESDSKEDLENKKRLDSGETSYFNREKRYIKKDQSIVWVYLSVSLLKNRNGEVTDYISQIIDITERKRIEKENKLLIEENNRNKALQLDEAKNMYHFLAENTLDLIGLHNLDTTFQYISPSVINILGYTPEEMIGKSPLEFAHPEDLKELKASFAMFINEEVNESTRGRFKTKEGEYIWLETKANIVEKNGIKTGFQSSSRDITIRKKAEEVTEIALLKERELNELRTNLVSTISHEFRTPMTTIRTSAELISMYMEGQTFEKAARLEKQLDTIMGEIDRIIELMNAVLTISKDDAGKTNFNPVNFDLKQLCLDVIETSFNNQEFKRNVKTIFKGNTFNVFADKNLMEYTLFNLLNNAFKYSEESSDVILKLSENASEFVLEIVDYGIGIPKEDQPKLFNTFFRASNTNGIQGTGLGLYIVKTFTEKNSGTIALQSKLGKGTKVTLKYPLKKT